MFFLKKSLDFIHTRVYNYKCKEEVKEGNNYDKIWFSKESNNKQ